MLLPQWITKKTLAWAFYDFADTAFSALFITFFFPILIKVHLGGNELHIGLAMGLSVLAAGLLVPLIGAFSDATGRRMPILITAAFATALLTVLAGYAGLGFALALGFFANIAHLISKDVYDAKMIEIVPRRLFGSLSGFGVGIGYFGTIASLAIGYVLLSFFGWERVEGIQAMFWEAGAFYVIFALPLFFLVPDRGVLRETKIAAAVRGALAEVRHTVAALHQIPVFARFLAASFFYNNGMNTAIVFLALYAREVIGMGTREFFPVFALIALAAAAGSFAFGRLSDILKPPGLIRFLLFAWIGIVLILIIAPSPQTFLAVGLIGGAALGAIWTLNRHMVTLLSPEEKIAEFFGFEGLTEKFSGLLGPIIFGYLAFAYGYTPALVSVIAFFLIGLALMRKL